MPGAFVLLLVVLVVIDRRLKKNDKQWPPDHLFE
jgi:hypothetical protein